MQWNKTKNYEKNNNNNAPIKYIYEVLELSLQYN